MKEAASYDMHQWDTLKLLESREQYWEHYARTYAWQEEMVRSGKKCSKEKNVWMHQCSQLTQIMYIDSAHTDSSK